MRTKKRVGSKIMAVMLAALLLLSALPVVVFAQDGPVGLATEARNVRPGQSFAIDTFFAEMTETNALTLEYSFEGTLFEYVSFTPAEGVSVVNEQAGEGRAMLTLMVADWQAQALGALELKAKDVAFERGRQQVTLAADYVVKDGGEDKNILTAAATVSFATLGGGPLVEGDTNEDFIVDMIDLSNMIDWFGYDEDTEGWDDWYVYFDFNDNGQIDVYDIAYVARLIGTSSRAALEALIARAEGLNEADYTAESWTKMQEALAAAKEVAANEEAEAPQIAEAIKNLKEALDALEKVSQPVDRAALEALAAKAKALNEAYYTPDSWLPLKETLAAAEAVLAQTDPAQAEIQAAYDGLLAAMQGLVLKADSLLELLRLFVESFEQLEESAFTPESWAPFKEVLTAARAMVDAGNAPDDEVLAMLDALLDAYERLVLDKTKGLRELMAQAEKLLEDPSGYYSGSVKKLQAALDAARELLKTPMEELEQEEIDAAAQALMDAISTLFEKGDVTPLVALVQYAQLLDEGLYTAASFGPFAAALATAAEKAAENDMLPEEVTALYNSLRAAIGALAPRANKTGLESAIAVAQAIVDNKGNYIEATIAGLEEALAAAKALYAKDEATQTEVDTAASDLMARAMAARKPANKRGLSLALDYGEAAPEGAQEAALEEARAVLEDPQATQEVVDAAKAAVDEAIG